MAVRFNFRGTYQIIDSTQVALLKFKSLYIAVVRLHFSWNQNGNYPIKTGHGVAHI